MFDSIVPVVVVGKDHSDVSRTVFSIDAIGGSFRANGHISHSITADRDLEVIQIRASAVMLADATFTRGNPELPQAIPLHLFEFIQLTPPVSWIPFQNAPIDFPAGPPVVQAAGAFTFRAGIRPRPGFDQGTARVITGSNDAFPPFVGYTNWFDETPNQGKWFEGNPSTNLFILASILFQPPEPLHLPAGLFHTLLMSLRPVNLGSPFWHPYLFASFVYRELD